MARAEAETPRISVVVPVRDEVGNLDALIAEIETALAGERFEIVYVDDCSTDGTRERLLELARARPSLVVVALDRPSGKSVGLRAGAEAARGQVLASLDGDGQNDPALLPTLIARLAEPGVGLAMGERVGRAEGPWRRFQSRVGNAVRRLLLADVSRDAGCGLFAMDREMFLRLPVFDGMHRFLPALAKREGVGLVFVPTRDRPRLSGVTKVSGGRRALVASLDLLGMVWLMRRRTPARWRKLDPP